MSLSVRTAGMSVKGRRAENQDRILFASGGDSVISAVVALADGMGGVSGGEIASREAMKEFEATLRKQEFSNRAELQSELSQFLNRAAVRMEKITEKDPSLEGMGTTFVASVLLRDGSLVTVNIGDSRSYVITPGIIRRITADHTLNGQALRAGGEVPSGFEMVKDYLTKALAPHSRDEADFYYHDVAAFGEGGAVVAVCSDGLYKVVTDEAIMEAIESHGTITEALSSLVSQAETNGSNDNISLVAMEIGRFARNIDERTVKTTLSVGRKGRSRLLCWLFALLAIGAIIFWYLS